MNKQQYLEEIKTDGLREASLDEDGYWDCFYNEENEKVIVWITDLE